MPDLQTEIRCMVINLDRATDRWRAMLEKARKASVKLERISAIDKDDKTNETLISPFVGRIYCGSPLDAFQVACFLSHRKAWASLLQSNDDWLAIFEDDVHFSDDIALFLNGRWIPQGVSLIRLETSVHRTRVSVESTPIHAERCLHVLGGAHMGSAGYLLSRDCARRLLALTATISAPVDCFLFDPREALMREMKVHQVVPALVIQEGVLAELASRKINSKSATILCQVTARKYLGPAALVRKFVRITRRNMISLQYRFGMYFSRSDRFGPEIIVPFKS